MRSRVKGGELKFLDGFEGPGEEWIPIIMGI